MHNISFLMTQSLNLVPMVSIYHTAIPYGKIVSISD